METQTDKTKKHYDLFIIGTGPAAESVLHQVEDHQDWRVGIADAQRPGGTCALRGCSPKKVLVEAVGLLDRAKRLNGAYLEYENIRIDWPRLMRFKASFTEPIPDERRKTWHDQGIEFFEETVAFVDEQHLQVGDTTIEAERIAVCTGSEPRPLPFPGAEHVLKSDDFLTLSKLPRHLVFIGAGYISMELAHVARHCGAEVTVIEALERPLASFEKDMVAYVAQCTRDMGIDLQTGSRVERVEKTTSGTYEVHIEGQDKPVETQAVFHGAGRVPATDRLNLEAGNIASGKGGVEVDEHMRSVSNPRVFAAGDVADTSQPMLTPVASTEGRVVGKNLLGEETTPLYQHVPTAAFTTPPLAAVGCTEEESRDEGRSVRVESGTLADRGRVRKHGGRCAAYKIIIADDSDQVLGAHIVGPHCEETVNLYAMAMNCELTTTQIKATLFTYPSFSNYVREMV